MRDVVRIAIGLLLVAAGHAQSAAVSPTVETAPVPHAEDAADDACFWVHPADAAMSTVIGTDKKGGLAVYSLDGQQIQYVPDGEMNNVDIRYGFSLGDSTVDLVAASNRTDDSISVYRVNPTSRALETAGSIATGMKEIYGLCMYRSAKTGSYFVFLNSESGEVQQWKLVEAPDQKVAGELVRTFAVGSKTEGCVADDDLSVLYIGEEEKGLWRYGAEPDAGAERRLVDGVQPERHLTADLEGLTIFYGPGPKGYLLASSQGDSTFAVYDREGNNPYLGSFRVGASNGIDAVTGTDGIDVLNANLGPDFPNGVFVTQDDSNNGANQNFKLVPWEGIANAMSPALAIGPSRNPRP